MTPESQPGTGHAKPRLSFWQIWNMCFGFLGLQFAFALQNGNVSRIFQSLGASVEQLPLLWVAAPLTALLVQPVIGYFSDRTWTRLGRRRPYFLGGALLASAALILMPFVVSRFDPASGAELVLGFNTSTAPVSLEVEVAAASTRFASLAGTCRPTASAPGSYHLDVPALDYLVCAAQVPP